MELFFPPPSICKIEIANNWSFDNLNNMFIPPHEEAGLKLCGRFALYLEILGCSYNKLFAASWKLKIESWIIGKCVFFFFHQLIIFKCHTRYKKERNLILDRWSNPSSKSCSPLCALQKTEVRYGWSLFFNVLLLYLYYILFVLLVCDCTIGLAKCRRTPPTAETLSPPRKFVAAKSEPFGKRQETLISLKVRACEIKIAAKATNRSRPKSPIRRQKKESALTVQLLGAVFRSEFSSCEPVTCSQRRCTWQQQIADSVFQRRRSQRSVDASFSPFFDLISKQTTTLLGTLSVLVQRLSWSFQEMYFVLMNCACTHPGP